MNYDIIDPDVIESRANVSGDHRYLQDATELEELSVQFVTAAPGESFVPYHSHDVQEEVFYVLAGELHVETPDGEYVVEAGQVFVAKPENPLRPFVPEEAAVDVEAIILNAPLVDDYCLYDPS